jgi:ATP-dependent exoDNAse (exonuclease V) alpha subunit
MIGEELKYRIRQLFGHVPTPEQEHTIGVFADFMTCRDSHTVMVLRGSAGTGKTTLAGAVVRAMNALNQKMVLLAPTGRAAKVFSLYAGTPAFTIHRRIYRQKSLMGSFELGFNTARDTLFIVDEASMIANQGFSDSSFGSGCLLDDLMSFVYGSDQNCRLLLIGDSAQLPPVGEESSPALSASVLRSYGMQVYEADLCQVIRQAQESGILYNATLIRNLPSSSVGSVSSSVCCAAALSLPKIRFHGFSDILAVPGNELIETLATSYSRAGMDDTIIITRSNKRANIYNQGIRRTVLDREDELCRGDRLMIVKNNYFWLSANGCSPLGNGQEPKAKSQLEFIANGDIATVQRVRNVHEQYGFRFAEVTLHFPDYDDCELTATVLLDTLTSDSPSLTHEQQQQLFERVMDDYADIPRKADRMKKLKEDRYYNALQVKFAYAVTCHKAQGGQWPHVYIDQGYMTDEMLTTDYLHWLYTAFTRATDRLFLVNWPRTQIEE